jgi:hypothetical protein
LKKVLGTLSRWADCVLEARRWNALVIVLPINLLAVLFTAFFTLRTFPNSADEYSYVISATLFAEGRLSVPSPEPKAFFNFIHIVNDGKYYGKYPPGWPCLLALGVLLKSPWLVNPLLAMASLVILYRIGRDHFSQRVANGSVYCMLLNPFLIFNAASYFSHVSCLVWCALLCYFCFQTTKEAAKDSSVALLGLSFGLAFLTRPYTALTLGLPFLLHVGVTTWKSSGASELARRFLVFIAPVSFCALLFLIYNGMQTGDPLLQPFTKYDPLDKPGLASGPNGLLWGLRHNLMERLVKLTWWLPLSGIILGFAIIKPSHPKLPVLASSVIALLGAYFLYFFHPGNEYGPRYLFEAAVPLCLVMGSFITGLPRLGAPLLLLILVLNGAGLIHHSGVYAGEISQRMTLLDTVREQRLANAVVFLKTGSGSMPPGDLTRNGIHFDGPVLYVLDLKEKNHLLMDALPHRTFFAFEYDYKDKRGLLSAIPARERQR